jgi:hypothetical protein
VVGEAPRGVYQGLRCFRLGREGCHEPDGDPALLLSDWPTIEAAPRFFQRIRQFLPHRHENLVGLSRVEQLYAWNGGQAAGENSCSRIGLARVPQPKIVM